MAVVARRVRQPLHIRPVWAHRVDVVVVILAMRTPRKRDQIATWRPRWKVVQLRRQRDDRAVRERHDTDAEIAWTVVVAPHAIGDPFAVRRERREAAVEGSLR